MTIAGKEGEIDRPTLVRPLQHFPALPRGNDPLGIKDAGSKARTRKVQARTPGRPTSSAVYNDALPPALLEPGDLDAQHAVPVAGRCAIGVHRLRQHQIAMETAIGALHQVVVAIARFDVDSLLAPDAEPVAVDISRGGGTSTRRWKNGPDGKFVASNDVGRLVTAKAAGVTAQGTWHVADNGTYCVTIDWSRRSENWCRYIFKVGEKYYGVKSINGGTTVAHQFEFSK